MMEQEPQIPPPYNNRNVQPFTVPEDYFDNNFIVLYEKTGAGHISQPWATPEDYFETHTVRLITGILKENSEEAFRIPEAYFTHAEGKIISSLSASETQPSREGKIISLRVLQRMAIAACLAGIAGLGYLIFSEPSPGEHGSSSAPCKTLACLTKKDLLDHPLLLEEEVMESLETDSDLNPGNKDTEKSTDSFPSVNPGHL